MEVDVITQERLKELIHYNPNTGVFTWIASRASGISIGDIAGCLRPDGYIAMSVDGHSDRAHRFAYLYMEGAFPDNDVDHINHIRNDNRWENLRPATILQNRRNSSIRSDNTSGVVGLQRATDPNKWCARIYVDGKNLYVGTFIERWNAICARKSAENMHGFHRNHGLSKKPKVNCENAAVRSKC